MIKYLKVTKIYSDGTEAVKEVSFSVPKGEFMFLVGPSGAGKTTLLKFLIRQDLPTAGEVWLEDENVCLLPGARIPALRRRVGIVFQDFKLLAGKTVLENIAYALEVAGRPDRDILEVVPFLIEQVSLTSRAQAFPHQLSAGEAQRVAIARALVHEPEVLLADEPTGNLDPGISWEIIKLLEKINEWGTTVVMATHDQNIVDTLRRRVVRIEGGKVVRDEREGRY